MDDIELILGHRRAWLTIKEFAAVYGGGTHEQTIRQDCARGTLPHRQARKGAPYAIHYQQLLTYTPTEKTNSK